MNTSVNTLQTVKRKDKIIYYVTTGIIAVLMLVSAANFAFNEKYKTAFQHFGLPNWFRIELTTAKFLGVLALTIPGLPKLAKEFAYFGFALTIISADVAHLSCGDSHWLVVAHTTFLGILAVSYVYYHKLLFVQAHAR